MCGAGCYMTPTRTAFSHGRVLLSLFLSFADVFLFYSHCLSFSMSPTTYFPVDTGVTDLSCWSAFINVQHRYGIHQCNTLPRTAVPSLKSSKYCIIFPHIGSCAFCCVSDSDSLILIQAVAESGSNPDPGRGFL